MFRIFGAALMVLLTVSFPPIAVLTIPTGIVWALSIRERRAERRRVLGVFLDHQAEQDRIKNFRRLG